MATKASIFFTFFIFCVYNIQAQSDFIYQYSTPYDEIPTSIIETADHGFIISAGIGTNGAEYQTLFIRLDKNGDTLLTKKINSPEGNCGINKLIKLENGTYIGIGVKIDSLDRQKLWLLNFSESLIIINDTSYYFALESLFNCSGFIDHSSNLMVYGYGFINSTSAPHPFVFRVSQNLDSLQFKYYNEPTTQLVYSMLEKPDISGYLLMITGQYLANTNSHSQILSIDYSLNVNQTDSIPGQLAFYLDSKFLNTDKLLITGKRTYQNSNSRTDKLGILKLDSSFQMQNEYYLGPLDTISYPGYYSNLDFVDSNKIFFAGTANQSIYTSFPTIQSYILVGRFDSSLQLTWKNYYGGDQYYGVCCLAAVSDGGLIIGATSYNYLYQNHERDIYILKVDSNGIITGLNDLGYFKNRRVTIYPNPGQNMINIETQSKNPIFSLFDLTGREIIHQSIDIKQKIIYTGSLSKGIYLYQVIENGSLIGYGKWIKK
jgi:hypothetical protein